MIFYCLLNVFMFNVVFVICKFKLGWGWGGVGGRYVSKFYYLNINWIFGDFRDFIKKVFEDFFCM